MTYPPWLAELEDLGGIIPSLCFRQTDFLVRIRRGRVNKTKEFCKAHNLFCLKSTLPRGDYEYLYYIGPKEPPAKRRPIKTVTPTE